MSEAKSSKRTEDSTGNLFHLGLLAVFVMLVGYTAIAVVMNLV